MLLMFIYSTTKQRIMKLFRKVMPLEFRPEVIVLFQRADIANTSAIK